MAIKRISQIKAVSIKESYEDFILSRKAKLVTAGTVRSYHYTLRTFLDNLEFAGMKNANEITAKDVRFFLSNLADRGLADSFVLKHAQNIKAYARFCFTERYIPEPILFDMPRVGRVALSYLKADQINKVIESCSCIRDKALIIFLIDTGLRMFELIALKWSDVDINDGRVVVRRGKGKKTRIVKIGIKARRALLAYRREVNYDDDLPVFQNIRGKEFKQPGLRSLILRISKRSGIPFTCHSLRRSFATLALKAGMSLVHIQNLMGHSQIGTTVEYIQNISEDVIEAHNQFSPIDHFYK
jgi:integrase/recombinase XerC